MDIEKLGIIQDELRNVEQLTDMMSYVKKGGIFNKYAIGYWIERDPHDSLLMELAHFPDGRYYIHNGHHRAVSIYLAGRDHLLPEEYYVKEWEYGDYNDIVFLNPNGTWRGYVTPFNIKREARHAQMGQYKDYVQGMWDRGIVSEEQIRQYILSPLGGTEYKRLKRHFSVEELALSIVNSQLQFAGVCDEAQRLS